MKMRIFLYNKNKKYFIIVLTNIAKYGIINTITDIYAIMWTKNEWDVEKTVNNVEKVAFEEREKVWDIFN